MIATLVLLSFGVNANAQSDAGTLVGRIAESGSGRSLEGAIVTVSGTAFSDYTDAEGRYSMSGLPAGEYEVRVTYVGLQPSVSQVTIATAQSTAHNVQLARSTDIENIVVKGQRAGADRVINEQKTAAGIVNVISEESFGAMVDGNIGQAMQRLPGISVDQDQDGSHGSINIRGIRSTA